MSETTEETQNHPQGKASAEPSCSALRRAFQTWYESDALPLEHSNWFRRDEDGYYRIHDVEAAWSGWKACAEALLAKYGLTTLDSKPNV